MNIIKKFLNFTASLTDLPPLFFRLVLAYGFYVPAMKKLADVNSVAAWFESMHYPAPLLNAYMAAGTEALGVVLLTLGLFTRIITLPLMVVMLVAITTVHLVNGYSCGDNGFEVPFYYLLMLFSLHVTGAGRISLDHLFFKNKRDGKI